MTTYRAITKNQALFAALRRVCGFKANAEPQCGSRTRSKDSSRRPLFTAAIRDEQGQALIWVALGMVLFLSSCAFALDLGHGYLVRKQLQSSADAAALAAGWHISEGSAATTTAALTYGSTGTLNNYNQGYTVDTPVVTLKCSSTVASWGLTCDASGANPTYNMVTVTEVAHVPTYFAGVMGFKTLTVSATSAASKGARPTPFNVAIVLDTTYSMRVNDPDCGNVTSLQCAQNAIGTILKGLDPAQDSVSLFTFPAIQYDPANPNTNNDNNCSGQRAQGEPYAFPDKNATTLAQPTLTTSTPHTTCDRYGRNCTTTYTTSTIQETYQVTGFSNSFISKYKASSLKSGDPIVNAIGQSSSCPGLVLNNSQNTYFASTIYQAQAALAAQQAANPKTSNAMIILSDGNATAVDNSSFQDMACAATGGHCPTQTTTGGVDPTDTSGDYPSLVGECGQAVDAAAAFNNFDATNNTGTLIFSIAYGAPSSSTGGGTNGNQGNCSTDRGAGHHQYITPCQTMQQMSTGWPTDKSNFFSDYNAPGGDSACTASAGNNAITNLNAIANAILSRLSQTRLIPPDIP